MSQQILQELDKSIQESREAIELGVALNRLTTSRDFKMVILDGYLSKEAVRLVHLKAAPEMQGEAQQKSIVSQLDSIGRLHQYLRDIQGNAEIARKSLNDAEKTREEILSEDAP